MAHARGRPSDGSPDPGDLDNLGVIRERIDAIDREIVTLLARREIYVRGAGRLKSDRAGATAPGRAAQVVDAAVASGVELGADSVLIRSIYTAMVVAFIELESRSIGERLRSIADE